jgi:ribosome-interacting GTPase 1
MAIFSVEIADTDVDRVINAVCNNYNYKDKILTDNNEEIINPESKPVFANRMVRKFLSDHVKKYELDLAKKALQDQLDSVTINDPQV